MSLQWDRDYKERYEDGTRFFNGLMNAAIISALIYVPILIWAWRTR